MIRRRLGSVALATLVLFVACTDLLGPLADSDSVRLVVRPSFAHMPANVAGDNPAAQVDNVHVILRNSAGAIVVDKIVEWPLGQDTLRLDLDVTVSGSESFELTIEGRAGEQILFQAGPMKVDLSEGGSSVETNPVLEYAGPGAGVATIEITGAPGSFLAGSGVGLSVTGTNDDGSAAGDLILVWASLDDAAATVGPNGAVAVGHDAARAVRIEARVAFTSIADTIEGSILPSELLVSPGAAALTALGAEQSLTAALLGVDGGAVSGVDIDWEVADEGVIGLTPSGASATATALATGETWAIASAAGMADSTLVTVAQTVDRVAVELEDTTFEQIGTTRQATATALDANDHAVADAVIDWTTRAPAVATVEADGTITAATPGTAWIVASSGPAADSVRTTVRNVDPELTILAPAAAGSFAEGEVITFEGMATDLEDGDLSAAIEWSSSATGDIGTGSSVADSLAPGTHTITAAITDSHGAAVSTAFEVVVAANTAPAVSITAPASAISVPSGTPVTFTGSATDTQDGSLSSSIQWSSSADGALGVGASLSTDDLSIGSHIITASVTDSRGLGAGATRAVEVTNNAPTVSIGAPASGAAFEEGSTITFEGTASDVEDGALSSSIQWSSDAAGELGTGASVSATLDPGTHTITAAITDSRGASASSAIDVVVAANTAPTVSITAPASAISVPFGSSVTFTGSATDTQDGSLSSSIQWSSSADGALGVGASLSTDDLSIGSHVITASVTDSRGLGASATRAVEVTNNAPTVSISAPASGAAFEEGSTITFEGAAADVEEGALSSEIQWSSDADGALGTGASVPATLSPGSHTITAVISDSHGAAASTAIEVTVAANTAPTVTITAPISGDTFGLGAAIGVEGSASDAQDGDLSAAIEWTTSAGVELGTGPSIQVSDLPVGSHTILASATDGNGASGSTSVDVTVVQTAFTIAGNVHYAGSGLAGVEVELLDGGAGGVVDVSDGMVGLTTELGGTEVDVTPIGTTTTDGAGNYTFPALPDGVYIIRALGPTGFVPWVQTDAIPVASDVTVDLQLVKAMTLLSPADGSTVSAQPQLHWEPNPEAARHEVVIRHPDNEETVHSTSSAGSYTVASPLAPGASYGWRVDAFAADGQLVGVTVRGRTFTVESPEPSIQITSPADDTQYMEGTVLSFAASASDGAGNDLSGDIVWTYRVNGEGPATEFGRGGSFTETLPVAVYAITAAVVSGGQTPSATVSVTIQNALPHVEITGPSDGTVADVGDLISFTASAGDPEEGDLSGDIVWMSSLNEGLGSGSSRSTDNLMVGSHSITASVSDGHGGTGTASITVVVNGPPSIDSLVPFDDPNTVRFGQQLQIEANASDPNDDDLTFAWTVDGDPAPFDASGAEAILTTEELLPGRYTVQVIVTDPRGLSDTASVEVTVIKPGLTILEPSDGTVLNSNLTHTFEAGIDRPSDSVYIPATSWNFGGGVTRTGWAVDMELEPGVYTVVATIAKSETPVTTDTIEISVVVPTTPHLNVVAPVPGDTLTESDLLSATATDAIDGDLSEEIDWSIDGGPMKSGPELDLGLLTNGEHSVIVSVTNSAGLTTSETIHFYFSTG